MNQTGRSAVEEPLLETKSLGAISKEDIRSSIEETGVVPAVRVKSVEDALFVAEALAEAGVPILEIAMNVPGAARILSQVAERAPKMIVGGGGITNGRGAAVP